MEEIVRAVGRGLGQDEGVGSGTEVIGISIMHLVGIWNNTNHYFSLGLSIDHI